MSSNIEGIVSIICCVIRIWQCKSLSEQLNILLLLLVYMDWNLFTKRVRVGYQQNNDDLDFFGITSPPASGGWLSFLVWWVC